MMFWHRHKWKVAGAQLLQRITRHATLGEMKSPITEVLEICECGALRTLTLDGSWTLEQLQATPGQVEADKEFFRKLGVKI
jgi:hypothetical protein